MVEEQRGYDDTRALPQQSSMFGEHAESAPMVEPALRPGPGGSRRTNGSRLLSFLPEPQERRPRRKLVAEEDARREAEHAGPSASKLSASKLSAVAKEEAERKEREKQEMLGSARPRRRRGQK